MDFEIVADLSTLDGDGLDTQIASAGAALDGLLALENPTNDDVEQAEAIAAHVGDLNAEKANRETAAADRVARMTALREAAAHREDEEEPAEDAVEDELEDEIEEAAVAEPVAVVAAAPEPSARVAVRGARPAVRPHAPGLMTITAAADVPNFALGQKLADKAALAEAVLNRMSGFPAPLGLEGGQQQHYGVASFRKEYEPGHIINRDSDPLEIIERVAKESRLPGGSLTAAGGWCSPSETFYDFCGGESTDGIFSAPEVQVNRGGFRYTRGPSFADIFADTGFTQTEAQAIAGASKSCYEVECPDFTEVRLGVVGLCIKVPILTQAAYPELVQRVLSLALLAQQVRVAQSLVTQIGVAAGAAVAAGSVGSVASDSLAALELVAITTRQDFRLSFGQTMEVLAPFWLKAAIRADLANRNGVELLAITDAQIQSYFAARNLSVQWLYGYQPLESDAVGFPATADLLMYPAGSFVKGTSDVITLNAVYDAAELSVNRYTGLFTEEGILLVQRCYESKKVTINVCAGGITGAASNEECFTLGA